MSSHSIDECGKCVNCEKVIYDWNTPCYRREPHTPFHGRPNEPVEFKNTDTPKV